MKDEILASLIAACLLGIIFTLCEGFPGEDRFERAPSIERRIP